MLRILILEDSDFEFVSSAIKKLQLPLTISLLNNEREKNIGYDEIHPLLDKYHRQGGFDILIVDLQFFEKSKNGLVALRSWLKKNGIEEKKIEFGIIPITNHMEEESGDALGNFPTVFGSNFLRLVPKKSIHFEENIALNINDFIGKKYVKHGDAYIKELEIPEKFKHFDHHIQLKVKKNGKEIPPFTISLSNILMIQRNKDDSKPTRIYTKEGFYEGEIIFVGKDITAKIFFAKRQYCFDPAESPSLQEDKEKKGVRQYYMPDSTWGDPKKREEEITKNRLEAKSRIINDLNELCPMFLNVMPRCYINILYIHSFDNKINKKYFDKKYQKQDSKNEPNQGLRLSKLSYNLESYDDVHAAIVIKYFNPTDLSKTSEFEKSNYTSSGNVYYPVFGNKKPEYIGEKNGIIRYKDILHSCEIAFTEICSDNWLPTLNKLRIHYLIQ